MQITVRSKTLNRKLETYSLSSSSSCFNSLFSIFLVYTCSYSVNNLDKSSILGSHFFSFVKTISSISCSIKQGCLPFWMFWVFENSFSIKCSSSNRLDSLHFLWSLVWDDGFLLFLKESSEEWLFYFLLFLWSVNAWVSLREFNPFYFSDILRAEVLLKVSRPFLECGRCLILFLDLALIMIIRYGGNKKLIIRIQMLY